MQPIMASRTDYPFATNCNATCRLA